MRSKNIITDTLKDLVHNTASFGVFIKRTYIGCAKMIQCAINDANIRSHEFFLKKKWGAKCPPLILI
jgi:hypothetical protein